MLLMLCHDIWRKNDITRTSWYHAKFVLQYLSADLVVHFAAPRLRILEGVGNLVQDVENGSEVGCDGFRARGGAGGVGGHAHRIHVRPGGQVERGDRGHYLGRIHVREKCSWKTA